MKHEPENFDWEAHKRVYALRLDPDERTFTENGVKKRYGHLYLIGKMPTGKWAIQHISLDGFLYSEDSAERYVKSYREYPLVVVDDLPELDWGF